MNNIGCSPQKKPPRHTMGIHVVNLRRRVHRCPERLHKPYMDALFVTVVLTVADLAFWSIRKTKEQ